MSKRQEISTVTVAATTPAFDELIAQVDRLLADPLFQNSDSNRQLLQFLVEQARLHPGTPLKEIELATSVFGLSLDNFDPQADSTVRVKVGRLRARIQEYYKHAGSADPVLLEIPRGAYLLSSSYRNLAEQVEAQTKIEAEITPAADSAPEPAEAITQPPVAPRAWPQRALLFGAGLLVGASLAAGLLLGLEWRAHHPSSRSAVARFWSEFTEEHHSALAVFSNPRLAGKVAQGGLHYYMDNKREVDQEPLNIGYSGAGDVTAVHGLTQLFDQYRWSLETQPGALLSWQRAENSNLIFIGRPEQNPALHQLPRLQEFYFRYAVGLVNAHPRAGEPAVYDFVLDDYDHAVIAYTPGIHPPMNTLILAGSSTWGSQAAAECMSNDVCIESILAKLGVKPGERIPYFEAVLRVKITDRVPVWNSIVAARRHTADATSWQAPLPEDR